MKFCRVFPALALLLLALTACDKLGPPPELRRGVQLVRWMTTPEQLSRSMYSTFQDGKASTNVKEPYLVPFPEELKDPKKENPENHTLFTRCPPPFT